MPQTLIALVIVALSAGGASAGGIIYLDRHGGLLVPGGDDSRTNTSSIVESPAELSPFPFSDASWAQVVACTRALFAPFDVEVTDVDPGDVPHVEAMIAGAASELGYTETLGIAPHDCGGAVENAIVYAFATDIGDDPQELCETAAQEIAHAFTLDHALDCRDPMTYLDACGPKQFMDQELQCGEDTARECWCGGTTQNSYRALVSFLGAAEADGDGDSGENDGGDPTSGAGGCDASSSGASLGWLLVAVVPLLRRRARRTLGSSVIAACLAGCSPNIFETQHIVLTGTDVTVERDRLVMPVETHPELAGATVGDLVAGTQAGGFVRSIADITTSDARYTLATVDVPFTDAIGDAGSALRLASGDDGDPQLAIAVELPPTRIYGDDRIALDVSGYLSFAPDLDVSLQLERGLVTQLRIEAAGRLDAGLTIDVTANAGTAVSADQVLFTKQHVLVQMVGWVPVVEVVEVEVGAHVDASVEGALQAHVDADIGAQLTAGIEYADQRWRTFGDASVARALSPIDVSVENGVHVAAHVYAEVRVRFYGLAGPYLHIRPELELDRATDGTWTRTVGLHGEAGADLALPLDDDSQQRFGGPLFDYRYPL